ncbi:MAG: hypothetical protein QG614_130 [Patescibacteria group bacterium]|nr:hypothetical protein [Patescibacteria group bacterium]
MTQKLKNNINKFFNKDILQPLMKIALPMIFVSLLQSAYQLVDAFWVGRLGGDAVAAVSVSFPINFLLASLGMGLTIASSTLISQYIGAKNQKMVNHVATQSLIVIVSVSLILTFIGYIVSPFLLQAMNIEQHIYTDALTFVRYSILGIVFTFIFALFQSISRSTGEMRKSSYIIITTVALNFILDPLFIFGYGPIAGHGVAGAALATLFTQGLSALASLYILFGGKYHIHIIKKNIKADYELIKKIFKIGIPSSIEQSSRSATMMLTTFIVAGFGTAVTASYGVGSNVLMFVIIPMVGLSISSSVLVGQNIGSKNIDRAVSTINTTSIISFISSTLFGVVAFIFAPQIVGIFLHNDPETTYFAVQYIKLISLFFGFIGIQMSLLGAFRASGDTRLAMNLTLISQWIIQLPLSFILSKIYGIEGLWFSFPISWILSYILTLYYYRKGNWKNKNLIHSQDQEENIKATIDDTKLESPAI